MKENEFDVFTKQLFADCMATLEIKGEDYTKEPVRFSSFKQIAEESKLPVSKVVEVLCWKHLTTTLNGTSTTKPRRKRFIDAINYLVLLYAYQEDTPE